MDVCCRLRWISSFIVQSGRKLEAVAGWRASITVTGNTLRRQKTANMSSDVKTWDQVWSSSLWLSGLKQRSGVEGNERCQDAIYQHAARPPGDDRFISGRCRFTVGQRPGPDHFSCLSHWHLLWLWEHLQRLQPLQSPPHCKKSPALHFLIIKLDKFCGEICQCIKIISNINQLQNGCHGLEIQDYKIYQRSRFFTVNWLKCLYIHLI